MHPSLHVYQQSVLDFIRPDFEIQDLSGDCLFTEGPVWNPEGYYLFSDITANCIYRIRPGGPRQVFLSNSGTANPGNADLKPGQAGSNALAYDAEGRLLVCRHGSHEIALFDGKELRPFLSEFQGKPLNSPNDLILHSNGSIYFSDPPYGLKEGKLNPQKFQPLAGVYFWDGDRLHLLSRQYQYPNGVCLSPDQQTLYICSNKPFEKFISLFDTGTNRFKKIFAEENSDGIECDRHGHVYLCNKDGIIILDAMGRRMALIRLATVPANICWGGASGNDLFITAREHVFLIPDLQK